jgi:hypothetical protein
LVPGSLACCCLFPAVIPSRCNRQGPITKSPSEDETITRTYSFIEISVIFKVVQNVIQQEVSNGFSSKYTFGIALFHIVVQMVNR